MDDAEFWLRGTPESPDKHHEHQDERSCLTEVLGLHQSEHIRMQDESSPLQS